MTPEEVIALRADKEMRRRHGAHGWDEDTRRAVVDEIENNLDRYPIFAFKDLKTTLVTLEQILLKVRREQHAGTPHQ